MHQPCNRSVSAIITFWVRVSFPVHFGCSGRAWAFPESNLSLNFRRRVLAGRNLFLGFEKLTKMMQSEARLILRVRVEAKSAKWPSRLVWRVCVPLCRPFAV